MADLAGQRGAWECPRCRAINAWWVRQCSCKPEGPPGSPRRLLTAHAIGCPALESMRHTDCTCGAYAVAGG